ncbi:hypothetical protein H9Q74_000613 [Fusarium xylarioides]|nr:hypothetical protein H9Q71_000635 [Fusarium xylarioides]KAG5829315.1 hypothetical protein H9Q74_000613 [Fusarium xylarioides]
MAPESRTWRGIKELINKCRGAELSDISSSASIRSEIQAETKSFSSYEDVSMTKELETSIPCPEMPCYLRNPHRLNPNFIGRDDVLHQLDEALLPSKSLHRRSFSLCGFGGIGKTEIAIHYAFTREKAFDAIFWVEADQATKLGRSFDYIAKGLGLIKNVSDIGHSESRQAVIEWLEDPQMKTKSSDNPDTPEEDKEPCLANWLLIFDNAESSTDLEDYWPKGHYGSVLITSRDPEFISVSDPAGKDGLTLMSMTNDDCALLLLKLAQQPVTEDSKADAKILAEKIHRVPLAIRQLAALIRKEKITVGEFLQYYGRGSLLSKLDQVQGYTLQDLYRLTISTVWRLETFKPAQISLLNKMAMMDPSQIDESILHRDVTCSSSTDVFPRGLDFVKTRTELLATSLIDRNSEIKALSTHRLVQEVTMEKMDHPSLVYNYSFVAELLRSSWHFKPEKFDREGQHNMDNLTPHIINLHGLKVDFRRDFPGLQNQRAFAVLFQECAWYLTQHGHHPDAGPLFDTARDICEQNQPELDDDLATTLFAMARWGVETGADANEVLSISRELLEIRKQKHDISCKSDKEVNLDVLKDLATAHTGMSQALLLLDRYQEAFDSAQRCIDLEAVLPEIVEGKAINQFAMIYQALALFGLERYDDAANLMDEIIAFRVRQFGSEDKNSIKPGLALQVLGQIYFSQGRYEDSRVVNVKALEIYTAVTHNKYYYRAAQVSLKLAECHAAYDQPEAASQYFDRAISTYKHHSHLKPDLARAYFKKAMFQDRLKHRIGLVVDDEEDDPRRLAIQLYSQLTGETERQKLHTLEENDFNKLVRIFSR